MTATTDTILDRRTKRVILAIVVAAFALDAVLYYVWGYHATISYVALTRAERYPILAFLVGVLVGHLYWPQTVDRDGAPQS